jgi:hypothetical protein
MRRKNRCAAQVFAAGAIWFTLDCQTRVRTMSNPEEPSLGVLGHQSLRRPLTPAESGLAKALEDILATGQHDYPAVVEYLQRHQVPRPSGTSGPWTVAVLETELRQINASLDEAYVRHDNGAAGR